MSLWLVRAGRNGEHEQRFVDDSWHISRTDNFSHRQLYAWPPRTAQNRYVETDVRDRSRGRSTQLRALHIGSYG